MPVPTFIKRIGLFFRSLFKRAERRSLRNYNHVPGAKVQRVNFTNVVLGGHGHVGLITNRLPMGAELLEVSLFNDNEGKGTVNIGSLWGSETDVATGVQPTANGVSIHINNLKCENKELCITAVGGAVTVSGFLLYKKN